MAEKIYIADKPTLDATKTKVDEIKLDSTQIIESLPNFILFDKPGIYEWTPPNNIKTVYITAIGAGGGGGAGGNQQVAGGYGSAGSPTSFDEFLTLDGGGGGTGGSETTNGSTARGQGGKGGNGKWVDFVIKGALDGTPGSYKGNTNAAFPNGGFGGQMPSTGLPGFKVIGGAGGDKNASPELIGLDAVTNGAGGGGGAGGRLSNATSYYLGGGGGGGTGALIVRNPFHIDNKRTSPYIITIGEGGIGGEGYVYGMYVGATGGKGGDGLILIEW